ncbi:hypothetical protein [Actibacterium lipolyticum]|uniref:hypothetical protein n=1 Tax=Actibacterium lipolyticum TaxID=1524263 RepID=UPI0011305353|nr:hypothetical protein [Actibacterium lipolyticum]
MSEPLDHAAFVQRGDELTSDGLRLIDVESEVVDGTRLYSGLWVSGSGSNLFDGPMGPIDLREQMIARREQGLRLVDFEIFRRTNGGRQYLAVWRPGSGTEILTGPMEQAAFFARGESLTADGLRLIDVEVERHQGRVLYSGLFQTGTGSNFITAPRRRSAFVAQRDEFVASGLELVDVERIRLNGVNQFVGVWASGPGESQFSLPRTFDKFVEFGVAKIADGFRTMDMELRLRSGMPDEPERPDPDDSEDPTGELPDNPPEISIVSGDVLTVDFSLVEGLAQLEFPAANLPEWLPRNDGEILLPDAFCGLNLRRADSIFWQVPGDDAVDDFPFVSTEEVAALGDDFFLGGVEFGGPIGACAGPFIPWQFPQPFLEDAPFFEPLPNMTLRIQLGGDGEVRFKENGTPNEEILSPRALYTDSTFAALLDILETFDPTSPNPAYCDGIDDYFVHLCQTTPGQCPVDDGPPPTC